MILCWFQISTVPISVYRYLYPYFLNLQCLVSNLRDNLHVQPKVKNNDVWVWVLFTFGCGVWSFFEDIFKMISTYYCRGCPWLNKFAKKNGGIIWIAVSTWKLKGKSRVETLAYPNQFYPNEIFFEFCNCFFY